MVEERKQSPDAQEVQEAVTEAAQAVENVDEGTEDFSMEQMEAFYDQSIAGRSCAGKSSKSPTISC